MSQRPKEKGVAIILVIFIVALATILVINLTYSTFLSTRSIGMVERQLQSEYLLKSLLNFSKALIRNDKTQNFDSYQEDAWGLYSPINKGEISAEFLGINTNAEIGLEIVPRNSKINITCLEDMTRSPNQNFLRMWYQLFVNFDFDDESNGISSENQSSDLIGNLVDWQDPEHDPFIHQQYQGHEDDFDEDLVFNKKFTSTQQLYMVEGFDTQKVNKLSSYIYADTNCSSKKINVNTAEIEVIRAAIFEDKDNSLSAENIYDQRFESQPITEANLDTIAAITNKSNIEYHSDYFQVYAKVKYGLQRPYYLKALVKKRSTNSGSRNNSGNQEYINLY